MTILRVAAEQYKCPGNVWKTSTWSLERLYQSLLNISMSFLFASLVQTFVLLLPFGHEWRFQLASIDERTETIESLAGVLESCRV